MQSTKTFLSLLLIAMACLAIYGQTHKHDYINYDDEHHVYHERIIDGFQSADIAWSFHETSTNLWHPLTWLSYHIDGISKKPSTSHAINGFLHGLNCLLLFWLLRLIPQFAKIALLVSLIHALHPLHVESVAWVSSRKDVLSQLMMLASCLGFVYFTRAKGAAWSGVGLVTSLSFAALALMAKPSAVVLAPVILGLDLVLLPKTSVKSRLGRTWCYFLLCAAMALVTMLIHQSSDNAELTVHLLWHEKIGLICSNYVHYLGQFFCPHSLSFFYRFPDELPYAWLLVSSAVMLLPTFYLAWKFLSRETKAWHVCFILFFVSYLPMCGWIVVSDAVRADRYMYLPYIFLSMAFCDLAVRASSSMAFHVGKKRMAAYASVLVCLWLTLLAVLAYQYTGHWKNNESLYTHAIDQDTKNYLAWHNLATSSLSQESFPLAREQFLQVLEIKPTYKNAHLGIAESYSAEGLYEQAEKFYRREIELHPELESHLAYAYYLFDRKQYELCISFVKSVPPDSHHFLVLEALSYYELKNFGQASVAFKMAISASPPTDELLINYAFCLVKQGKFSDAKAILAQVKNHNDPRRKTLTDYVKSK